MINTSDPYYVDVDGIDTGVHDWPARRSLEALQSMYEKLDIQLERTTKSLALPCKEARSGRAHCADCCEESVYLTGLEWLLVVDYAQRSFSHEEWATVIHSMLQLYAKHSEVITRVMAEQASDAERRTLRYRCPLLDDQRGCRVYPAREMLGRLFGQSANKEGGIYGCQLSGAFFTQQPEHSLLSAEAWSRQLRALPLTQQRGPYPYWFFVTYGQVVAP